MRYIVIILVIFIFLSPGIKGQDSLNYEYALIEAVKQKNLGNIPGAIELYQVVLKENDKVAVAYYELGTLYALTGLNEKAIENLQKAFELEPGNKWYTNAYLDVLMMNERFREAKKILKKILKEDENVEYNFRLANLYFIKEKNTKALRLLDRLEQKHGISDKITLLKANIYEKEKKYDKAGEEIEIILEYFPESIDFLVIAAELANKDKDKEKATDYYLKVLDIDSTNIYALTNLTDYYREQNNFEKSLDYLERSFKSDQIDYEKKYAIISYYTAGEYFIRNYSSEIEKLLTTLLMEYPDNKEVKLLTTDFYIRIGNYQSAYHCIKPLLTKELKNYQIWSQGILLANSVSSKEDFLSKANIAYEIFPDSSLTVFFKGLAEFQNDKPEMVIKTFSTKNLKILQEKEMLLEAEQLLAESYHETENYNKSDSLFREIIKKDAKNYVVLNNFSYYLSLRDASLDEAKRMSYEVIKNNPLNSTYLDTYAWILYKMNEYHEAEKYISKALINGGENDPDINEHAGDIYYKLQRFALAKSYYQKALDTGGERKRIIEKLEEIIKQDE